MLTEDVSLSFCCFPCCAALTTSWVCVPQVDRKWAFSARHSWQSWRDRYCKNQDWFNHKIKLYQKKKGIVAESVVRLAAAKGGNEKVGRGAVEKSSDADLRAKRKRGRASEGTNAAGKRPKLEEVKDSEDEILERRARKDEKEESGEEGEEEDEDEDEYEEEEKRAAGSDDYRAEVFQDEEDELEDDSGSDTSGEKTDTLDEITTNLNDPDEAHTSDFDTEESTSRCGYLYCTSILVLQCSHPQFLSRAPHRATGPRATPTTLGHEPMYPDIATLPSPSLPSAQDPHLIPGVYHASTSKRKNRPSNPSQEPTPPVSAANSLANVDLSSVTIRKRRPRKNNRDSYPENQGDTPTASRPKRRRSQVPLAIIDDDPPINQQDAEFFASAPPTPAEDDFPWPSQKKLPRLVEGPFGTVFEGARRKSGGGCRLWRGGDYYSLAACQE